MQLNLNINLELMHDPMYPLVEVIISDVSLHKQVLLFYLKSFFFIGHSNVQRRCVFCNSMSYLCGGLHFPFIDCSDPKLEVYVAERSELF